jgi:uncharacterized protein YjbI with pentapeptide repeats
MQKNEIKQKQVQIKKQSMQKDEIEQKQEQVKKKFWEIQKKESAEERRREWNEFNQGFYKKKFGLFLVIKGNENLPSIDCSGWEFNFLVNIEGKFTQALFDCAIFNRPLVVCSNFSGDISFTSTAFNKPVLFSSAKINNADFSGVKFKACRDIRFFKTEFNSVSFSRAIFFNVKKVTFDHVKFLGEKNFSGIKTNRGDIFNFIKCNSEPLFNIVNSNNS